MRAGRDALRRRAWAALAAATLALAGLYLAQGHEVRRFVAGAATPVGVLWVLLGALALLLWRRRDGPLAALAGGAWLLLSLAGNAHLASLQLAALERLAAPATAALGPPLDAVLVLGGGVELTARGRLRWRDAAERVVAPVVLYHQGAADTLVASGPYLPPLPPSAAPAGVAPTSYPRLIAHLWTQLGVEPTRVVLLEGPRNTQEEVAAFRALAQERGWRHLGVVTSAWHLPRALRHCRRAGLAVRPIPCDVRSDPPRRWWRGVVPSSQALGDTATAWTEALALLAGR